MINSEKSGQIYADLLAKLLEMDPEEMLIVAASLKASADTMYVVRTAQKNQLMQSGTGSVN